MQFPALNPDGSAFIKLFTKAFGEHIYQNMYLPLPSHLNTAKEILLINYLGYQAGTFFLNIMPLRYFDQIWK